MFFCSLSIGCGDNLASLSAGEPTGYSLVFLLSATASKVLFGRLSVSFLTSDCHRLFAKTTFSIQSPAVPCARCAPSVRTTGGRWVSADSNAYRQTSTKISFIIPEARPPQPSDHKIGHFGISGFTNFVPGPQDKAEFFLM